MTIVTKYNLESSGVFCPPPLGKPNPQEIRPLNGQDTRQRVIQHKSKGDCWFAVLNLVRERWKAPNTDSLVQRQFEKAVSDWSKIRQKHLTDIPFAGLLENLLVKDSFSITHNDLKNPDTKRLLSDMDKIAQGKLAPLVDEFERQNEHPILIDYLVHIRDLKVSSTHLKFIEKIENVLEVTLDISKSSSGDQVLVSLRFFSAKHLGFKVSDWNPKKSFAELIKELLQKGPLIVGGFFEKTSYTMDPIKTCEKIENRPIYEFLQNSHKEPFQGLPHAILIVGAKTFGTKDTVLFIDPNEESNPNQPDKQKIYAMSYERLSNPYSIGDNMGEYWISSNQLSPPQIGYALYKENFYLQ